MPLSVGLCVTSLPVLLPMTSSNSSSPSLTEEPEDFLGESAGLAVPAEVLTAALYVRFRSRQEHTFAEKVLSAMRFAFVQGRIGLNPIDNVPCGSRRVERRENSFLVVVT